jgi:hypothetical protein
MIGSVHSRGFFTGGYGYPFSPSDTLNRSELRRDERLQFVFER